MGDATNSSATRIISVDREFSIRRFFLQWEWMLVACFLLSMRECSLSPNYANFNNIMNAMRTFRQGNSCVSHGFCNLAWGNRHIGSLHHGAIVCNYGHFIQRSCTHRYCNRAFDGHLRLYKRYCLVKFTELSVW